MTSMTYTQRSYLTNFSRQTPNEYGEVKVEYVPSPTIDALVAKGYLEPVKSRARTLVVYERHAKLTQKALDEGFGPV